MAQPVPYQWFFRKWVDPDWYYYEIDATDAVFENISETPLDRAPEGWADTEVVVERGFVYYGMLTSYTTPLKFLKDGAHILRYLMFTYGSEAQVQLLLKKFNPDSGVYAYETFFAEDIDIGKAVSEFDYVLASAIEGGFAAKLKAREDTEYEYDLEANADVEYVKHDGLELQAKLNYGGIPNNNIGGYVYPELFWIDTEGSNITLNPISQSTTSAPTRFLENNSGSSQDIDITLDFNVSIYIDSSVLTNSYFHIDIREVVISTSTLTTTHNLYASVYAHVPNTTHSYIDTATITLTVPTDTRLEITYRVWNPSSTSYLLPSLAYTLISISETMGVYFVNRFEETYVPTLKLKKAFDLVVQSIAEDATITVTSSLIESAMNNEHFITSGDGLRSLSGSKIKLSFKTLFEFLNKTFCAACWYNADTNTFYIESRDDVFVNTVNPDFTLMESVVNFKAYQFTQETFNNLKIGGGVFNFDAKGADDKEITNGKDDFTATSNWLTPVVKIKKDADYVSPIKYSPYAIEFVRINLEGKELADASSDNELYMMHCEDSISDSYVIPSTGVTIDYRLLFRTPILVGTWEIENVFSPETIYNIIYSPARSIYRNGKYFRSLFKYNDGDNFKFQLSGKNNVGNLKMITKTGGFVDYDEGTDIAISTLCADGAELFFPAIFEFETKEVINLYQFIKDNPFNTLEFPYNGNNYRGFILEAHSTPTKRGKTKLRLLAAPDTTITDLIS